MLEFTIDETDSDEEIWLLREAIEHYRDVLRREHEIAGYDDTRDKIAANIKLLTNWADDLSDCLQIRESSKKGG